MDLDNAEAAVAVFEARRNRRWTFREISDWSRDQAWGPASRGEVAELYRLALPTESAFRW